MRWTSIAVPALLALSGSVNRPLYAAAASVQAADALATGALLDVPFISQEPYLCGGACLAMVARYWGTHAIQSGDFAGYARGETGIAAEDMITAARGAGFDGYAFTGDGAFIQSHIGRGRPVVALIDVGGDLNHYVVIVGWNAGVVTIHDPARRPFVTVPADEFLESWASTGHWALLLLPHGTKPDDEVLVPARPDSSAIHDGDAEHDIDAAVALSRAGRLDEAASALQAIATRHPASPAPWRELSGVRFRQRRWDDAAQAAARALERDQHDAGAWHILGASRFMLQQRDEALDAWNVVDAPILDLVRIDGLERTRHRTVAGALGMEPDDVLTAESVRLARRRLALVPSVAAGRVDYRPNGPQRAQLEVAVTERPVLRTDWMGLGVSGMRALTERTVSLSVPSPTGGGETWEASYRWWERRPRAMLALVTPELAGLHGNIRIEAAAETQSYAVRDAGSATAVVIEETSREATLTLRQWAAPDWLWEATTGLRRIRERGDFVVLGAALERWSADDRRRARAGVVAWPRVDRSDGVTAALDMSARSRWDLGTSWDASAWIGWSGSSPGAPRALWSGAGTGQGRDGLLRAHPLLASGVIDSPAFAPSLAVAGVEATRWIGALAGIVGMAAFVDGACVTDSFDGSPWLADAGVGVRVRPPGQTGQFRIDFATGLVDDSRALSVAWQGAVPVTGRGR
ncbi:MAG TPA: C39 family peptidase [Candidatus Krumholzibacteria bacterium]|nr:C39 family peptidase [Candidatus Krumholzibacteria bacterium]